MDLVFFQKELSGICQRCRKLGVFFEGFCGICSIGYISLIPGLYGSIEDAVLIL